MDERERRLAENEVLFREVNERTKDVNERWSGRPAAAPPFQIVCECGQPDCALPLQVGADVYEEVRAHGARFLVARGHERPDVERVVAEHEGINVVEKLGESKPYVTGLDPRSRS